MMTYFNTTVLEINRITNKKVGDIFSLPCTYVLKVNVNRESTTYSLL